MVYQNSLTKVIEDTEPTVFSNQYAKLKKLAEDYKKEKETFLYDLNRYTSKEVGDYIFVFKEDSTGQICLYFADKRIKFNQIPKFIEVLKEFETLSKYTEEEFNSYIRQRKVLEKI